MSTPGSALDHIKDSIPLQWTDEVRGISVEIYPVVLKRAAVSRENLALYGTYQSGELQVWRAVDCGALSAPATDRSDLIGIAARGSFDGRLPPGVMVPRSPVLLVAVGADRSRLGLWSPASGQQTWLTEIPLAAGLSTERGKADRMTVRFEIPQWVWAGALLLGAAAVGANYYSKLTNKPEIPADQPSYRERVAYGFGIQASRVDRGLEVRWDAASPALRSAPSGVLKVADGDQLIALPLTSADLAAGRITYMPRNDSVNLELAVDAGKGPISERVTVVLARTTPAVVHPPQERKPDAAPPVAAAKPARPSPAAPPPPAAVETRTQTMPAAEPVEPRSEPVSYADRSVAAATRSTEAMPVPSRSPAPAAATVPAATPPVVIAAGQVPAQIVPQPQLSVPVPQAPKPVAFLPPTPIRQASLVVPETLRKIIMTKMVVEVTVRVMPNGSVGEVRIPSYPGVHGHLAELAQNSARNWRFKPATRDGQPVESTYVIRFNFDRKR